MDRDCLVSLVLTFPTISYTLGGSIRKGFYWLFLHSALRSVFLYISLTAKSHRPCSLAVILSSIICSRHSFDAGPDVLNSEAGV